MEQPMPPDSECCTGSEAIGKKRHILDIVGCTFKKVFHCFAVITFSMAKSVTTSTGVLLTELCVVSELLR